MSFWPLMELRWVENTGTLIIVPFDDDLNAPRRNRYSYLLGLPVLKRTHYDRISKCDVCTSILELCSAEGHWVSHEVNLASLPVCRKSCQTSEITCVAALILVRYLLRPGYYPIARTPIQNHLSGSTVFIHQLPAAVPPSASIICIHPNIRVLVFLSEMLYEKNLIVVRIHCEHLHQSLNRLGLCLLNHLTSTLNHLRYSLNHLNPFSC